MRTINRMISWRALAAVAAVLACGVVHTVDGQNDDGWNYSPLKGVRNKENANFLALAAAIEGNDPRIPEWFASFKATFYKTYPNADHTEEEAYNNFVYNLNKISLVNSDLNVPFWLSGNFYADYDYDSFRSRFLMTNLTNVLNTTGRRLLDEDLSPSHDELVARRRLAGSSVDWRSTGKLTPVKDQGGCGSCWAYSATAAVETAYLISQGTTAANTKIDMSEQQLIDCVPYSDCGGGSDDDAIRYINSNFQVTEALYPARFADGTCKAPKTAPTGNSIKIGGVALYPANSEAGLMAATAINPVAVYFSVAGDFFSYAGGIYQPTTCSNYINHAIVVVGYSYTGNSATSYWIIRNSWGNGWGINGYAYIQMTGTSAGPCGMYQFMFRPPLAFDLTLSAIPTPSPSPSPPPKRKPPPPKRKPPPPKRKPPPPKRKPPPPKRRSPPPRPPPRS